MVPLGLGKTAIWDESSFNGLYSGHADSCDSFTCVGLEIAAGAGEWGNWDIDDYFFNVEVGKDDLGNEDKTTHAYWAKDSIAHTLAFNDTDASYQMARNLAVRHNYGDSKTLDNGVRYT